MNTKPFAIALIIIVVLNLVLFAMGMIPPLVFWIVTAIIAIIAWKVLPKLREDL